jgi:hypothetical protein
MQPSAVRIAAARKQSPSDDSTITTPVAPTDHPAGRRVSSLGRGPAWSLAVTSDKNHSAETRPVSKSAGRLSRRWRAEPSANSAFGT